MAKERTHKSAKARRSTDQAPRVRVRMYRQGLGDCFLITFAVGTPDERHMLIDCGTLGASTTPDNSMNKIINHIGKTVSAGAGRLTILVATHEHKDHLSGFNTAPEAFSGMK